MSERARNKRGPCVECGREDRLRLGLCNRDYKRSRREGNVRAKPPPPPPRAFYETQQGKELLLQKDFEGRAEEFKRIRILRLAAKWLPACVIAERTGCSETFVAKVAKGAGFRLPTFSQWDEVNAA